MSIAKLVILLQPHNTSIGLVYSLRKIRLTFG